MEASGFLIRAGHWLVLSEVEAQSHLNLARAADGFVDVAQAKRAVVEVVDLICGAASGGLNRGSRDRKSIVILVLRYVVDGYIEAGGVGHVEHVKAELQVRAFGDVGVLDEGNVQ